MGEAGGVANGREGLVLALGDIERERDSATTDMDLCRLSIFCLRGDRLVLVCCGDVGGVGELGDWEFSYLRRISSRDARPLLPGENDGFGGECGRDFEYGIWLCHPVIDPSGANGR